MQTRPEFAVTVAKTMLTRDFAALIYNLEIPINCTLGAYQSPLPPHIAYHASSMSRQLFVRRHRRDMTAFRVLFC